MRGAQRRLKRGHRLNGAGPNVFSIPPGKRFLATLVNALLNGRLIAGFPDPADPLSLARATLLLPTRRACRAVLDCFLDIGGPALLLPRIRAIGDEEENAVDLSAAIDDSAVDLPPAIPGLLRRTTLTRFILAWGNAAGEAKGTRRLTAGDAAFLAGELARLMDLLSTQGVPWDNLDAILPQELQEHWQVTHDFLQVARQGWPRFLAAHGSIDPAQRRRLVMEAELARLGNAPDQPVIAAGSTGSIPTTAELLAAISRLPRGALVLPGYDRHLSAQLWANIAGTSSGQSVASHPQSSLHALVTRCHLPPDGAVVHLDQDLDNALSAREALFSRVMWPAEATGQWNLSPPAPEVISLALGSVGLIEAASEEEEGLAIALAMRHGLETPGAHIALITPNRALARRVTAELQRFDLTVDDTAGTPLSETTPGVLARLVAETAAQDFAALPLLALLKHPMVRLGLAREKLLHAVSLLEQAALRGLRPQTGIAGLRAALALCNSGKENVRLTPGDITLTLDLVERLEMFLQPLATCLTSREAMAMIDVADMHRAALAHLIDGTAEDAGEGVLWTFFDELADAAESGLVIDPREYAGAVETLMQDQPARAINEGHSRLRIYGLLEARLLPADLVILGGLNEGIWPATARTDAWLSRGMRLAMSLPAPEQRIGLAAHDFTQALGARDVILTRALKAGTAPSVPSRWLQRLAAVIGESPYQVLREKGQTFLDLAGMIDAGHGEPRPCPQPEPRPPLAVRPRALLVTEIETLIRDPYAIYARHVLKLRALEDLDKTIDARERGTLIHACLERVQEGLAHGERDRATLLAMAEREFAAESAWPQVRAFWWPRFLRIFDWFLIFDERRRMTGAQVEIEASGRITWPAPAGVFTLRGRADRLEIGPSSTKLIDFKTGAVPTGRDIKDGFAPQLTLEAAMLQNGAFAATAGQGAPVDELLYVKLSGGDPPAEEDVVKAEKGDSLADMIDAAWTGLHQLIAAFDKADAPYRALGHAAKAPRYNDYLHLARVREWGVAAEGGEE